MLKSAALRCRSGLATFGAALLRHASAAAGRRIVGVALKSSLRAPNQLPHDVFRLIQFCSAVGADAVASGMIERCGHAAQPAMRHLAHDLLLRRHDFSAASTVASSGIGGEWTSAENQELLALDRMTAQQRHRSVLLATTPSRPGGHLSATAARRRLTALAATGRVTEALHLLDTHDELLPTSAAATARFDLHWLLGDEQAAAAAAATADRKLLESFDLVVRHRRLNAAAISSDATSFEAICDLAGASSGEHPDWFAATAFEFGQVHLLLDLAASPVALRRLGPNGRLAIARAQYVSRDFAGTNRSVRSLIGTSRHWDAEKLHSRVLLETGRYAEALALRRRRGRLRPTFDEVEFFSLLHLGRHREAFGLYLEPTDRLRLGSVFAGESCHERGGSADVFIVPMNGPGDELLGSLHYAALARSNRVAAACDPRLAPLLQRSFRQIDFTPTTRRMAGAGFGLLKPGGVPRPAHELFDLLDCNADAAARTANRVVLGRSLFAIEPRPADSSPLVVDPRRVPQRRDGRNRVGLVWRSEVNDPMRRIHYIQARDLTLLARLDCDVICLQSDATVEEMRELAAMFGERLDPGEPDLDLRDDLDGTAALIASLDAVVGVGTTTVELSASIGTPTIMMHPNRIGAWRATETDHDYWHPAMMTAAAEQPDRPVQCVAAAKHLLIKECGFSSQG